MNDVIYFSKDKNCKTNKSNLGEKKGGKNYGVPICFFPALRVSLKIRRIIRCKVKLVF